MRSGRATCEVSAREVDQECFGRPYAWNTTCFQAKQFNSTHKLRGQRSHKKYLEQNRELRMCCINISKAFDNVERRILWELLSLSKWSCTGPHWIQEIISTAADLYAKFWLDFNIQKTEVLGTMGSSPAQAPTDRTMNGAPLEVSASFRYLGSFTSDNCGLDCEKIQDLSSCSCFQSTPQTGFRCPWSHPQQKR